jgi:NADPH:quinone reductase-like Zn-dependent oxidoreductase
MPRAVRFDEYGPVDVLNVVEVAEPSPGRGEVVVAVVASAINPGEIAIREGQLADQWPATFPSGQGTDFAGRIRAVGDGVTGWHVDDEVVGWTDDRAAQAEFVRVPADHVVSRPAAVPWHQAAGLPVAGCTAYAAVHAVDPKPGETVLVSGAAGGVGSLAIQLLRNRGTRVLGVAGAGNVDWLNAMGVEPIVYGDGLEHRLRQAAPNGIDAAIDTFGGGYVEQAIELGVPPERINTIIDFDAAQRTGAKTAGEAEGSSPAVLAELAELVAAGELTVPVAEVYPLEQVRTAYSKLAKRHTRGKIVLEIAA